MGRRRPAATRSFFVLFHEAQVGLRLSMTDHDLQFVTSLESLILKGGHFEVPPHVFLLWRVQDVPPEGHMF